MKEKAEKLFIKLTHQKQEIIEELEQLKKDFVNKVNLSDYKIVNELDTYCEFTRMKSTAKQIEEIDVKLRTVNYLLKEY